MYNWVMSNAEIVQLLRNMAAAMLIKEENRFRIIAYEKAADAIEHLTSEVKDLWDDGKLTDIPGVGPALAQHLDDLMRTGRVKHFENTFKDLSPALFPLLLVPGLGPKRAYQLTKTFKITNPKTAISELEKVAKQNKIAEMEGWGEKSQTELLNSIETYKRGQIKENRMALPYADRLAQELIEYLDKIPGINRLDVFVSLRRKVATIGDIDMAVATTNPEGVLEAFIKYPKVRKIVDRGPKGATVLLSIGRQADLRIQAPHAYGAMLQYFTGSKHHNIHLREYALSRGLSLNEHGIKALRKTHNPELKTQNYNKQLKLYEFETEESFYKVLGMEWMPPEIREDFGEIEAALNHKLPKLVELKDIKGDLHVHSNYDLKPSHDLGSSSLEELLNQAAKLGYEYIGISDHNPKMSDLTDKQIVEIMRVRHEKFEQIYTSWNKRVKKRVQIFTMLEVDIGPTGKLALPEAAFVYVDAVIVSVHSSFTLPRDETTRRLLTALAHPKVKILGHPTGRLLGSREGIDADWINVMEFCKAHNKALEINSWPERLDLPDRLVREAVNMGVRLVIDTDSHAAEQMTGMKYGVDVARRGWAEANNVVNTLGYNEFSKWIKS